MVFLRQYAKLPKQKETVLLFLLLELERGSLKKNKTVYAKIKVYRILVKSIFSRSLKVSYRNTLLPNTRSL
jgi:hypothetical protein